MRRWLVWNWTPVTPFFDNTLFLWCILKKISVLTWVACPCCWSCWNCCAVTKLTGLFPAISLVPAGMVVRMMFLPRLLILGKEKRGEKSKGVRGIKDKQTMQKQKEAENVSACRTGALLCIDAPFDDGRGHHTLALQRLVKDWEGHSYPRRQLALWWYQEFKKKNQTNKHRTMSRKPVKLQLISIFIS